MLTVPEFLSITKNTRFSQFFFPFPTIFSHACNNYRQSKKRKKLFEALSSIFLCLAQDMDTVKNKTDKSLPRYFLLLLLLLSC